MHSDNNEQRSTPEELANQAHAHALEASLRTMEEFIDQEDKLFITAYEPVYRAVSNEVATFEETIAVVQSMVDGGEMSDADKAEYGYEPTRFIPLVDTKRSSSAFMVVFYEGQVSGERGYGVVKTKVAPVVEMEVFTSPQHLLEVYGDEVVLATARIINDRGDEIRMNDAFDNLQ